MTLTAAEFLQHFVQHILPRGFVRIASTVFWPFAAGRLI